MRLDNYQQIVYNIIEVTIMNIQNLKKARNSNNLTQSQVAEKLGITAVAYQNYEYGKREPSNMLLCQLADLFHVTTDYLLGRNTDEPNTLDQLAIEFDMTVLEQKIVENYLSLPEHMRGDLMEFLRKSVKEVMDYEK